MESSMRERQRERVLVILLQARSWHRIEYWSTKRGEKWREEGGVGVKRRRRKEGKLGFVCGSERERASLQRKRGRETEQAFILSPVQRLGRESLSLGSRL